jgi:hypothetical protein
MALETTCPMPSCNQTMMMMMSTRAHDDAAPAPGLLQGGLWVQATHNDSNGHQHPAGTSTMGEHDPMTISTSTLQQQQRTQVQWQGQGEQQQEGHEMMGTTTMGTTWGAYHQ